MAAEVVSQNDWFNWSLNQLAREFGIARETVQSRLRSANINPNGERRGFPVYSVAQAAKAILVPQTSLGVTLNDPDKMSPQDRAYWFKAEIDRVKLEREIGAAVYVNESREQMAVIAKTGLQVLETLPDILERDFGLDADVIAGVEARVDVLREQWANLLEETE
ncbi:DUF1441 family protein [Methylomonas sp. HYX-M1]|uniref:DUF1441 family protein n=1 Tax=Methylomonas sp. HYX-M1 TaxID=3139307 RepID=UPI00345BDC2E